MFKAGLQSCKQPNASKGIVFERKYMKNIITISRLFGAGGGIIGKEVAHRLGYYYCDKDIILQSAMKSGHLEPEYLRKYDEKLPKSFGFGQSLFDFYSRPLSEKIFEAQRKAIFEIGEKRNCVIVGRNSNVILKEFDRTLHVFITATDFFRVKNLKNNMPDSTDREIKERMKSVDKARAKSCAYYTDTRFGDAGNYDLCLKSSTLGIDRCVDLICEIAQGQD